jgi:hypothetical protein
LGKKHSKKERNVEKTPTSRALRLAEDQACDQRLELSRLRSQASFEREKIEDTLFFLSGWVGAVFSTLIMLTLRIPMLVDEEGESRELTVDQNILLYSSVILNFALIAVVMNRLMKAVFLGLTEHTKQVTDDNYLLSEISLYQNRVTTYVALMSNLKSFQIVAPWALAFITIFTSFIASEGLDEDLPSWIRLLIKILGPATFFPGVLLTFSALRASLSREDKRAASARLDQFFSVLAALMQARSSAQIDPYKIKISRDISSSRLFDIQVTFPLEWTALYMQRFSARLMTYLSAKLPGLMVAKVTHQKIVLALDDAQLSEVNIKQLYDFVMTALSDINEAHVAFENFNQIFAQLRPVLVAASTSADYDIDYDPEQGCWVFQLDLGAFSEQLEQPLRDILRQYTALSHTEDHTLLDMPLTLENLPHVEACLQGFRRVWEQHLSEVKPEPTRNSLKPLQVDAEVPGVIKRLPSQRPPRVNWFGLAGLGRFFKRPVRETICFPGSGVIYREGDEAKNACVKLVGSQYKNITLIARFSCPNDYEDPAHHSKSLEIFKRKTISGRQHDSDTIVPLRGDASAFVLGRTPQGKLTRPMFKIKPKGSGHRIPGFCVEKQRLENGRAVWLIDFAVFVDNKTAHKKGKPDVVEIPEYHCSQARLSTTPALA